MKGGGGVGHDDGERGGCGEVRLADAAWGLAVFVAGSAEHVQQHAVHENREQVGEDQGELESLQVSHRNGCPVSPEIVHRGVRCKLVADRDGCENESDHTHDVDLSALNAVVRSLGFEVFQQLHHFVKADQQPEDDERLLQEEYHHPDAEPEHVVGDGPNEAKDKNEDHCRPIEGSPYIRKRARHLRLEPCIAHDNVHVDGGGQRRQEEAAIPISQKSLPGIRKYSQSAHRVDLDNQIEKRRRTQAAEPYAPRRNLPATEEDFRLKSLAKKAKKDRATGKIDHMRNVKTGIDCHRVKEEAQKKVVNTAYPLK